MAEKKPNRKRPSRNSELTVLKKQVDDLSRTVRKLKDILQVQDNWHSHISPWIKRAVMLWTDGAEFEGILLWTDRYTLGLEIDGEENIFNKGQIVRIKLAKEH
jgi:hypothetical protein